MMAHTAANRNIMTSAGVTARSLSSSSLLSEMTEWLGRICIAASRGGGDATNAYALSAKKADKPVNRRCVERIIVSNSDRSVESEVKRSREIECHQNCGKTA